MRTKEEIRIKRHEKYLRTRDHVIAKSAQYREDHKEELKLKRKQAYQEKGEILRERNRLEYIRNRDNHLKSVKGYADKNKDKIKEQKFLYAQTPEGRATQARSRQKRYWKEKETDATLTAEQWQKIINSQNNKCAICGKPFNKRRFATRDHIIPCSLGGGLTYENIQALCNRCNSSKRDKLDPGKIITWLITTTG